MQETFLSISKILKSYQAYWRQDPFIQVVNGQSDWHSVNPALYQWVTCLTPEVISWYKQHPAALLNKLNHYLPLLQQLDALCQISSLDTQSETLSDHLAAGIPGRKRQQIEALGSACLHMHAGEQWLEWCSGKGYLGRLLAANSGQRVTSFEYQSALCEAGQQDADKLCLPMRFVQGDAFEPSAEQVFERSQHAVALHACGDLHTTMVGYAVKHQLSAISFSPCCYHLIAGSHYTPMSNLAQKHDLHLNRQELRIPLQATVTGGERVKRHRQLEMTFRLSFDILCQQEGIAESYMSVPSIKKSALSEGFAAFCYWAASKKALNLDHISQKQFETYLKMGEQRYWLMEALSLVQDVFRRPLEVWLALDKGFYLLEHDYEVSMTTFCHPSVTPRNLLIQAKK